MKWILKKGTILFIGVFICLFASCVKPPPLPELPEPPPESPLFPGAPDPPETAGIPKKQSLSKEGYTLHSVEESEAWLKANTIQLDIDVGSNSQFNLQTVVTYKTRTGTRVDTMLIVNDNAGNQRVFEKY